MTLGKAAVLRPGDWVRYDDGDHQVIALGGTSVWLRSEGGAESVVLMAYLMACPEFAVVEGAPAPGVEPFGLLDSLPRKVLEAAREWERHIVEVETGLPPHPPPGATPRDDYDPAHTTMLQRARAKAAELGVSVRTVQARQARYARQGLWGLVDQRAARVSEATGRADAQLVAAIREVLDAETDPEAVSRGHASAAGAVCDRPAGGDRADAGGRVRPVPRLDLHRPGELTDIVDAVCTTAARTRVELVCVDELHNLNLATRTGAEVSDQLKYFAERLPATFIYAGIDVEAQGLFAGVRGGQIAGRFTVIPATPFHYGTTEQREQWRALVATLESTLRLHRHRVGTLVAVEEYLYQRTGGMIGSLSQLVRGAAILAIEDGSEQITRDLLDLVPVDYAAERAATPPARAARARRAKAAG